MSCNGCRVLRKGCSETCILRPCLQWIDTGEAQGHATVFVAKFFGRAGLMSFISAVPEDQRPALFQSLLFEACGRTLNPVSGAVGLLWTGNGSACQAAVDTVLRGGALRPNPELLAGVPLDEASEVICSDPQKEIRDPRLVSKRRISHQAAASPADLGLSLSGSSPTAASPRILAPGSQFPDNWRLGSPSMNSEESGATSCFDRGMRDCNQSRGVPTLLNLFV